MGETSAIITTTEIIGLIVIVARLADEDKYADPEVKALIRKAKHIREIKPDRLFVEDR